MRHPPTDFVPQRPAGRGAMRMVWRSLLFMHWPVSVEALRAMQPRIPDELEIDTFNGAAWLGLIPFTMRGVRPWWAPGIPTATNFHECNVRTYVTLDGQPGVWFFSLDAASKLAVLGARSQYHLPYFFSRMSLQREGDVVTYSVSRLSAPQGRMRCVWRVGASLPQSRSDELAHFLTERYMLYAANREGEVFRCRIWHEPWRLRQATLMQLDDGLIPIAGGAIPEGIEPLLHHADQLDVRAWRLERVTRVS